MAGIWFEDGNGIGDDDEDEGNAGSLGAESKLKGVPLRIWPLNSTANGRNFGADQAKTVPAAGADRQ